MKHLLYLSKIMGGRPMRQLKRLAALTFALFCCLQTALAYDFSAVSPSGHTLYYTVISGTSGYRVYVAYPNTGEALGSFEPNDGNEIIDENGDSVYYDGENWEGNFTSLNPGKGYLYHSVANETKMITF